MLWDYPSWLLRLNLADMLGASAYTLALALLESLLVTAGLIVAAWLARRWLDAAGRLAFAAGLLVLTALLALALHMQEALWPQLRALLAVWLAGVAVAFYVAHRSEPWNRFALSAAHRLQVLVLAYVGVDLVGLLLALGRNL